MTREEVVSMVGREIADQWSRTNLHRVDLRRCLVTPTLVQFFDTSDQEAEAWVLLRESPGGGSGFAVVFEESTGTFGLAQFADGYDPLLIGRYPDFFSAFDAM